MRGGEELLVYDPVSMTKMGTGKVRTAGFGARVLSTTAQSETSAIGKAANALYDVTRAGPGCKKKGAPQPCVPYNFPSMVRTMLLLLLLLCLLLLVLQLMLLPVVLVVLVLTTLGQTKQHYPQQRWRSSVYEVSLDAATPLPPQPRPGAMAAVSYVLQIAKTQTRGARILNSLFEDSTAMFGRWKSSDSVMKNCTFRTNGQAELEMQLIGSFYEGPITINNVTLEGNSFEVNRKRTHEDGTMAEIITMDGDGKCCNVTDLRLVNNAVVVVDEVKLI